MSILDIKLIMTIIKTGICTVGFIVGLYLVFISREKWEGFLAKLTSTSDVEVSSTGMGILRAIGVFVLLVDLLLVSLFFF